MVKNLPASAGDAKDMGSIPGWGRYRGGGNGNPLHVQSRAQPPSPPGAQGAGGGWGTGSEPQHASSSCPPGEASCASSERDWVCQASWNTRGTVNTAGQGKAAPDRGLQG